MSQNMETKTHRITHHVGTNTHNSLGAKIKSGSVLPALLLAGVVLFGFGVGGRRCTAQCTSGTFPTSANTEETQSMGVFQISVNPNFWSLFQANGTLSAYPGWNNSTHTVTSPVLYDYNTSIMSSAPQSRFINFTPPIQVGNGTPYSDNITGYPPDQPFTPFVAALSGTREVLTEIQAFTLGIPAGQTNACGCGSPLVPCPPGGLPSAVNFVIAGQGNPNLTAGITLNKSVGLVQSQANGESTPDGDGDPVGDTTYDFPASSFFDIFVEVVLPNALPPFYPSTVSSTAFPLAGAALYSDPSTPLIVQNVPPNDPVNNPALCGLPPAVVYIHGGNTFAPNLYFAQTGPVNPATGLPYYNAGDILGSVVLAGHGTLTPCDPPTPNEALLIADTLGTNNQAKPWMPIGWLFPDARFPWPTVTYDSLPGTNFDGGSVDAVTFTINTGALWLRGLSLGNLVNAIDLPSPGNSVVYTNTNTLATCEISLDGTNYFPGTASGPMQISIYNTNTPVGNVTNYNLQMLQLTLTGSTFFGNFYLQLNPTTNSSGSHIVKTGTSGGYVIGSYFDLNLQISTDDENFFNANRSLHVQQENAPCGAATEPLHIAPSGSSVVIWWGNPGYTLQGSTTLSPAAWVSIPGTSPITNSAASFQFYRLTCD
jgi:hypothetical protein